MSDDDEGDIFQGKSPFKGFRMEAVNRKGKHRTKKTLTGSDALDFAKSVAVDPAIASKPENQAALKDLLACIARAEAERRE